MRVRVKVCGITRERDIARCEVLGVDFLGLVFVPGSKRCLDLAQAQRLLNVMEWAQPVGLFMNQSAEQVGGLLDQLPQLALLQFHGDESAEFCAQFGRPYIKALAMSDPAQAGEAMQSYSAAQALLLDAHAGSTMGGSGQTFDWHQLPGNSPQELDLDEPGPDERGTSPPWFLAGGLTPQNVAQAIQLVRPFAVDVSSGVETAPGHKNADLLKEFFSEVSRVNSELTSGTDDSPSTSIG